MEDNKKTSLLKLFLIILIVLLMGCFIVSCILNKNNKEEIIATSTPEATVNIVFPSITPTIEIIPTEIPASTPTMAPLKTPEPTINIALDINVDDFGPVNYEIIDIFD